MLANRFATEQIFVLIQQGEADLALTELCCQNGSATQRSTNGGPSTAAWVLPMRGAEGAGVGGQIAQEVAEKPTTGGAVVKLSRLSIEDPHKKQK